MNKDLKSPEEIIDSCKQHSGIDYFYKSEIIEMITAYHSQFTNPSIPSDADIETEALKRYTHNSGDFSSNTYEKRIVFEEGAKYVRDQIGCSVLNEEEMKKLETDCWEEISPKDFGVNPYFSMGFEKGFKKALSLRSGECDKELPFDKVTRIEIINHNPNEKKHSMGRTFVSWRDDNYVYGNIQDNGKTLKIFIEEKSPHQTK